jgi:deoxyribodipyrimidine photolyase-related protein
VSRTAALAALDDFIARRLALFGTYQDAMWISEPFLFHARLSAALDLKLLDPREVIAAAERALHVQCAPLAAVEGFVRQISGWRESIRGVHWHTMPGSLERNPLAAHAPLPRYYWTGETEMRSLRECIGQTLRHRYAHPIQRLMVTALFALLHRPRPRRATALRGLAARTRDARFIAAAKGGVEALVRSLAIDYAAQGVRVNAIAPGLTRTPMSERMLSRTYLKIPGRSRS